jgi:hypothetical protein
LKSEVLSGAPIAFNLNGASHLSTYPELYDNLISASKTLPNKLAVTELKGDKINIEIYDVKKHADILFSSSNGSPQYHESSYNPDRLWGWIDFSDEIINKKISHDETPPPWSSRKRFDEWMQNKCLDLQSCQLVIIDKELNKPIGMIRLSNNTPKHLCIKIGI